MPIPPNQPPCPETPNCVSSRAEEEEKLVSPLPFSGAWEPVMKRLAGLVSEMSGARVAEADGPYLRATFRSRVFGFVDDLELLADPEASVVHVRSASRTGTWDLGANRRRVESLRAAYLAKDQPRED